MEVVVESRGRGRSCERCQSRLDFLLHCQVQSCCGGGGGCCALRHDRLDFLVHRKFTRPDLASIWIADDHSLLGSVCLLRGLHAKLETSQLIKPGSLSLVEGHYGCRNRTHFIECYAFGRGATRGIAQCLHKVLLLHLQRRLEFCFRINTVKMVDVKKLLYIVHVEQVVLKEPFRMSLRPCVLDFHCHPALIRPKKATTAAVLHLDMKFYRVAYAQRKILLLHGFTDREDRIHQRQQA
mmetsp:Transcript_31470/g.73823  ORF Transcript_31470/g.73823 Transcript_31470/m.73823 type:complete len:238 (-) Transcript_31470:94-807(-)